MRDTNTNTNTNTYKKQQGVRKTSTFLKHLVVMFLKHKEKHRFTESQTNTLELYNNEF